MIKTMKGELYRTFSYFQPCVFEPMFIVLNVKTEDKLVKNICFFSIVSNVICIFIVEPRLQIIAIPSTMYNISIKMTKNMIVCIIQCKLVATKMVIMEGNIENKLDHTRNYIWTNVKLQIIFGQILSYKLY